MGMTIAEKSSPGIDRTVAQTTAEGGVAPDLVNPRPSRSVVLRTTPVERGKSRNYGGRWVSFTLAVSVTTVAGTAISQRLMPDDGPGRMLYLFHDYVFLPLVGYLWTWAFPYSLAWWVPAGVLLSTAVFSWLFGVSLLRYAQRKVINWACSRGFWARGLRHWHRWRAGKRFHALYLEIVIANRYGDELRELKRRTLAREQVPRRSLRKIIRVVRLHREMGETLVSENMERPDALFLRVLEDLLILQNASAEKEQLGPLNALLHRLSKHWLKAENTGGEDAHEFLMTMPAIVTDVVDFVDAQQRRSTDRSRLLRSKLDSKNLNLRRRYVAGLASVAETKRQGRSITTLPGFPMMDPHEGVVVWAIALLSAIAIGQDPNSFSDTCAFIDEYERLVLAAALAGGGDLPSEVRSAADFAARAMVQIDLSYSLATTERNTIPNLIRRRPREQQIFQSLFPSIEWREVVWRERELPLAAAIDAQDNKERN